MHAKLRILFVGDIVGAPGKALCKALLPKMRTQLQLDGIIVNGENSASDGRGITPLGARFLVDVCGVDVITTGNHVFAKREIQGFFAQEPRLLRPANFPSACPGQGIGFFTIAGATVAVLNLQGRVFMRELLGCPFKAAESAILYARHTTPIIFVDMHAETTSEKIGLGYHLDGQVSCIVGTHTHVSTADERILPRGTAFITDVGASCAVNSMIGMKKEPVLHNLITQMPAKFEVDVEPPYALQGIVVDIDRQTGKAISIERVRYVESGLNLNDPELKDK
jgi:2',3'-cyclic-nucleotide 2'-phosphodiesterase